MLLLQEYYFQRKRVKLNITCRVKKYSVFLMQCLLENCHESKQNKPRNTKFGILVSSYSQDFLLFFIFFKDNSRVPRSIKKLWVPCGSMQARAGKIENEQQHLWRDEFGSQVLLYSKHALLAMLASGGNLEVVLELCAWTLYVPRHAWGFEFPAGIARLGFAVAAEWWPSPLRHTVCSEAMFAVLRPFRFPLQWETTQP